MPAVPSETEAALTWSTLVGHAAQVGMLRRAAERGRLGSTLLFAGPHGIGKRRIAMSVAQSLFCERHVEAELLACGECSACKQVAAHTHPDLIVVRRPPGKAVLPIALFVGEDESRGKEGMCHELSLRPMSAGRRIAIIDEAELMGDEAANALLKTLEEPPRSLSSFCWRTPRVPAVDDPLPLSDSEVRGALPRGRSARVAG